MAVKPPPSKDFGMIPDRVMQQVKDVLSEPRPVAHADPSGPLIPATAEQQAAFARSQTKVYSGAASDTYRMVDFVRAVAMHDERGQEVRVNRVRIGGSVDRDSPEKAVSIVLNGDWFDIATNGSGEKARDNRCYRVHVTNVVSAER